MPQPDHSGRSTTCPTRPDLARGLRRYFSKVCMESWAWCRRSQDVFGQPGTSFRALCAYYNTLMPRPLGVEQAEARELVAVVVSSRPTAASQPLVDPTGGRVARSFFLGRFRTLGRDAGDELPRGKLTSSRQAAAMLGSRLGCWTHRHPGAGRSRHTPRRCATHGVGQDRDLRPADVISASSTCRIRFAIASDMMPNDAYHGLDR